MSYPITKEDLNKYYIDDDFSMKEISKLFNTSITSIHRLCKKYNINKTVIHPKRTKAHKSNKFAFYNKISKEEVYNLYVIENKTITEMSQLYNISTTTVKKTLAHYNITKPKELAIKARKKTLLLKYGVEYYSQLPQFKDKIEQTHLKNCGYRSNFQDPAFKKLVATNNLKNFGVKNLAQLEMTKAKVKATKLIRYGDENYQNTEKIKETNLKRYGVTSYSKTEECKQKVRITSLKRYGETSNFKTDEFKEQSRQTCLKKYGVEHPMKSEAIVNKVWASKKLNNTIVTSSFEETVDEFLLKKFIKVERQYSSDKYPFKCDFYIPEKDLYIEFQGHFSHGGHPFDKNNIDDLKKLAHWQEICNEHTTYKGAINVWTVRDPLKRETAKRNNLNWIEFFSMKEFEEWYNEN